MTNVFKTIIVTDQAAAQALAQDENMFNTGLSATGAEPASHWISSGWMPQDLADLFPDATDTEPYEAMAVLGLQMVAPLESVQ